MRGPRQEKLKKEMNDAEFRERENGREEEDSRKYKEKRRKIRQMFSVALFYSCRHFLTVFVRDVFLSPCCRRWAELYCP